jgi:hypothetical protein
MHFEREDMMTRVIEAANADDLPAILAFLEKSGLPQDGFCFPMALKASLPSSPCACTRKQRYIVQERASMRQG